MHILFFSLNIVVISAIPVTNYTIKKSHIRSEPNLDNSTNISEKMYRPLSNSNIVLGWITFSIYILFKVTNEIQKVYLLFGLIRSPFYSTMTLSGLISIIGYHLRALFFNFIVSLYLVYYFKSLVIEDTYIKLKINSSNNLWKWLEILAIFRTLRWIWQNSVS